MSAAASDVRAEDAFDVAAVDAVIKAHVPGLDGMPKVTQFTAGASNLTFGLAYANRSLVLRRPPRGARPKSGHSMIREYTVMKALKPAFPTAPDALFHVDASASPLGAEFYVMEHVDGVILNHAIPSDWGWSQTDVRAFCERVWDLLIDLHSVDYKAVGLGDFGEPNGYVERQILGWNARYEKALTGDADPFEDVRQWLTDNRPATEAGHCIVHGDFRIDNMIIGAAPPHPIKALLDWEISALGDPLMDLGASLVYWVEAGDPPELAMLKKQPSDAPGMMTRAEVVRYYAQKTGRIIDDFTPYLVYGVFRLAVIAQQIYYRYYHKQTTNPAYAPFGPGAKGLGQYARHLIREGAHS